MPSLTRLSSAQLSGRLRQGLPKTAPPVFSVPSGWITFGTTVTITADGASAIYYTIDGSTPTVDSIDQAVTPLVVNAAITVKAIAVRTGYRNSTVVTVSYTQAVATAPSSVTLSVGSVNPVAGITNVGLPAPGGTNTSGKVTGWVSGTADNIAFTVVDTEPATSAITINGTSYTSGTDYTIGELGTLTTVVTTSETGKSNAVRTFGISVFGTDPVIGDFLGGGYYIGKTIVSGITYNLILSPKAQGNYQYYLAWPGPQTNIFNATDDGYTNTVSLASKSTNNLSKIIRNTPINGYSDWYWPCRDELYVISAAIQSGLLPSAEVPSDRMWSSSAFGSYIAGGWKFYAYALAGTQVYNPLVSGNYGYTNLNVIRAVRKQLP